MFWINDKYDNFAECYDWMKKENPERTKFFERVFTKYNVAHVLDCACGTGRDFQYFTLWTWMYLVQIYRNLCLLKQSPILFNNDYFLFNRKANKNHFKAI